MSPKLLFAAGALGLAVGCTADYSNEGVRWDDDSGATGEVEALRIDATPTFGLLSDEALTQTFFIDTPSSGLRLELDAPVWLSGTVTGYDAAPTTSRVSVPGSTVRVEGVVQAWVPDTAMSRRASFGAEEAYRLQLVPDLDYVVAWVPTSPAELPFQVRSGVDLSEDLSVTMHLDYGMPVFGQVLGEDGTPLREVPVYALDPASGVAGPVAYTGLDGRYALRLYAGEYTLVVGENSDQGLPTQRLPVLVSEDGGVEQDVFYGHSDPTNLVDGDVLDPEGSPLSDVVVRLTSISLDETPYGSLVSEADTASNGRFSVRAQPGLYQVEYLPPPESGLNPLALLEPVQVVEGRTALPDAQLTRRETVEGVVIASDGLPLAGAVVRATELAFDGYVFETVTDNSGQFALEVTDTDLRWVVVPPPGVPAAILTWDALAAEVQDAGSIELSSGVELAGLIVFEDAPAPFTALDLRNLYGELLTSVVTDAEGHFSFRLPE